MSGRAAWAGGRVNQHVDRFSPCPSGQWSVRSGGRSGPRWPCEPLRDGPIDRVQIYRSAACAHYARHAPVSSKLGAGRARQRRLAQRSNPPLTGYFAGLVVGSKSAASLARAARGNHPPLARTRRSPAPTPAATSATPLPRAALGPYVQAIWGWDKGTQLAFHQRSFDPPHTQIMTIDGHDAGALTVDYRPTEIYLRGIEIHPDHQDSTVMSARCRDG
jgi:hypothetical protein